MSSTESFDDLEQKFSGLLEDALREIREEFEQRLRGARERLEERFGAEMGAARQESEEATARLAEAEAATAALEQRQREELAAAEEAKIVALAEAEEAKQAALADAEAAREAALAEAEEAKRAALEESVEQTTRELLDGFRRAASAIDTGGSQAEILGAMLLAAGDFASRTALFLTREDGLQGWSSHNFPLSREEFRHIHLDYAEGSAWSQLAEGRGTVELGADDCGALCDPIDQSRPGGGVLIPLVLGDRLAAALYADQIEDAPRLRIPALQLLTYVTAQALETLPLRRRRSTATLRMARDAAADEPSLDLWNFETPAPPIEEPVSVPVEADFDAVAAGPEAEETVAEEPMRESWLAPEDVVQVEETGWEAPVEVEEAGWGEAVEPEPVAFEAAEESGFAVEEVAEEMPPTEAISPDSAQEQDFTEEPVASGVEPMGEAEPVVEPWHVPGLEVERPAEEEAPEEEGVTTEELPARDDLAAAEEPQPEIPAGTIEVGAAPRASLPTEVVPPAPAAMQGAEVMPPEDLEGPGWAFTTRAISSEEGLSPEHEEARRLARLLVTEIKLYNEEQVEEGRRDRNVYHSLREDIDRSRQIYEDRIDPSVRESTDYFYEELVRILAAGDAEILGM